MNNSYASNIYSGQLGGISELQGHVEQHPHLNNHHHYQQQQHQEYPGTHNSAEGLKEAYSQERESIIANNTHAQQPNHGQVAYQEQVPLAAMDNADNANNHDGEGEMEVLEEEHIESEAPPASGEEAGDGVNPDNEDQTDLKEDEMQVEKLDDIKDDEGEEQGEEKLDEDDDDKKDVKDESKTDGEKQPKTRRRDGEPADLEICRVCQSKDSLSDIFELDEVIRICDMIIKICPNVKISERDHLPHKICKGCVEKVKIAHEFKNTCENTDKELRKTLKRSYNKSRRTTDFVIVNCPMSDEDDNDDEPQDDDEYKVSQSEVESEPVTSDDSFTPASKKIKKTPKRRGRKPRSESSGPTPVLGKRRGGRQRAVSPVPVVSTPRRGRGRGRPAGRGPGRPPKSASKSPGLANVVYIEAPDASSSDSDDDKPIGRRRRRSTKSHDCSKCDESFGTGVELKEHLLTHKGDLFPCTKCDKTFKSKVYLSNHLERHDQDDKRREEKSKAKELKKQAQRQKEIQKRRDHEDRVKRHRESGGSAEKKKKMEPSPANSGRDLFKCVAPLTSTYWSDSFSD